jgi:uncharacterized membrane protein
MTRRAAFRLRTYAALPAGALLLSAPLFFAPVSDPILDVLRVTVPLCILISIPVLYFIERTRVSLSEQVCWRLTWLLSALLAGLMLAVDWLQVRNMCGMGVDTGIILNSLYNTSLGHFFYNSHELGSHFGFHNSPILLLLYPLYLLIPNHWALITPVIAGMAVSVPFVYRIARVWLAPGAALCLTAAYMVNPVVISQALPEFHEMNLAILPMVLILYHYFVTRKFGSCVLWIAVLMAVKESMSITVLALGVASLIQGRKWHWWAVPATMALAWTALSLGIVMPLFSSSGSVQIMRKLFGQETMGGVVGHILTNPGALMEAIRPAEMGNTYLMLLSWGVVPVLLSAWTLMAVPHMALLLLMENDFSLRLWDAAILGPLLAVSAAIGICRLARFCSSDAAELPGKQTQAAVLILLLTIAMGVVGIRPSSFGKPANLEAVRYAVRMVPDHASLTVSGELAPYLHRRHVLRTAPWWLADDVLDGRPVSECILVIWDDASRAQLLAVGTEQSRQRANHWDDFTQRLMSGDRPYNYELQYARDGVYLARLTD